MSAKFEITIAEVEVKYPQFKADRVKYEKTIIKESLQWRIDHPDAKNFSLRKPSIRKYFSYLDEESVRTVQSAIRNKFYSHKDDTDYQKYWNEPALSQVFSDLDKTSTSLTRALVDVDTPTGLYAKMGVVPVDTQNCIEVILGDFIYKGKLKSLDHFYTIIDAVRNY
jgi:hypothetical protein